MTSNDDEEDDRPRGILTTSDRDYLIDAAGYSRQASHVRRTAIAERTTNAIRDCWLLNERLEDRTISRIADDLTVDGDFHELDPAPPELADRDRVVIEGVDPSHVRAAPKGFHRGMVDAVALFYRIYGDDIGWFERLIEQGVRSGISHSRGGRWSVEVDIDASPVDTFDLDEVVERLEAGDHAKLSDLDREIVIARLANKGALDLDALRETSPENETPPPRANETLDKFRDRLPIGHEIARLRDPQKRPARTE